MGLDPNDLELLEQIEERGRRGLSQIGYSEVICCVHCREARWIREGVHDMACALWELFQLVKRLKGPDSEYRLKYRCHDG